MAEWVLKKGIQTDTTLIALDDDISVFKVNPQKVTITPRLRVAIEDTLDGVVISPWIDPQSETNIGDITVRMEGNTPINYQNNVNKLLDLSMSPFLKEGRKEIWQLLISTPMFKKLVLLGYMTSPMVISESADNPWYPSWSMTFTIWGGQIKIFKDFLKL